MLEMYSWNHLIYVSGLPIIIASLYFVFKNKPEKFKYYFLFSLTIIAWVIHFSRYWLEPNLKYYNLFFTDLCGFSTMMYPFFFLSKNKILKDYMYYLGAVFAFLSLIYPNNIDGNPMFEYNSIRFFFAHVILVTVPVLLILWKMHTPNIKHLGWMFLFLIVGAIYNMALSAFFVEVGLTHTLINYMGIWGNTDDAFKYFLLFAPWLTYQKTVGDVVMTVPIPFFYMIPGALMIYMPTWALMSLPFIKRRNKLPL